MRHAFPFASRSGGSRLATHGTLALFLSGTLACAIGPSARTYGPAKSVLGVQTTVHAESHTGRRGEFRGELLLVEDSALVVLTDAGAIVRFRYDHVRFAKFEDVGDVQLGAKKVPTGRTRRRLSLFARFPFGLAAEPLDSLLRSVGQTTTLGLDPPDPHIGSHIKLEAYDRNSPPPMLLDGELLQTLERRIVIRSTSGRLYAFPYACIMSAYLDGTATDRFGIHDGQLPTAEQRDALAPSARFGDRPSPDAIAAILATTGQSTVHLVTCPNASRQ